MGSTSGIVTQETATEWSFEKVKELNGSNTLIDKKNKVVKIVWNGIVSEETAKVMLTTGADLIDSGLCDKLLLNRKGLEEFSTEARVWIKQDLLKNRAKKLVNKVSKVATINSSTIMGGIFANFISTAIKLVFPNLTMTKFESEEEAMNWLTK